MENEEKIADQNLKVKVMVGKLSLSVVKKVK